MADLVQNVFGFGGQAVGGVTGFVMDQWGSKLGQVAFFAAVLFWFVNNNTWLDQLRKMVPGAGMVGAKVANAVFFGALLYIGMKLVFEPFMLAMAQRQEKLEKMTNN